MTEAVKKPGGPRLALLDRGSVERVFPVSEKPLILGRDDDCDIPLRDHLVSKQHARVLLQNGAAVVEDLSSSNGTRVNERKVAAHHLGPGDVIRAGFCCLVFLTDDMPVEPGKRGMAGWIIGKGNEGPLKIPVTEMPLLIGLAPEAGIRASAVNGPDFQAQILSVPGGAQAITLTANPPRCRILSDGNEMQFGRLRLMYRAAISNQVHSNGVAPQQVTVRIGAPGDEGAIPVPPGEEPPKGKTVPSDSSLLQALADEVERVEKLMPAPGSGIAVDSAGGTGGSDIGVGPDASQGIARPPSSVKRVTHNRLVLTATAGPLTNKSFEFKSKTLTIGRDRKCHIVIPDQCVSRKHACLKRNEGIALLVDLDSGNGVYLNNRRIRRQPIKPGDIIRVSDSEFLVHL